MPKKSGDRSRELQNRPESVGQSQPSLDQSSQCKGGFQSYLSKLYIDNGITYVQFYLSGESFGPTLKLLPKMLDSPNNPRRKRTIVCDCLLFTSKRSNNT
jgi:hypothetical protein